MTIRMIVVLALALLLAACGGGSGAFHTSTAADIPPQAQEFSYGRFTRSDISYIGRQEYKEAMALDCEKQGYTDCSTNGGGWFVRWSDGPRSVAIPDPEQGIGTYNEDDVIRRAVAIVNRSLPAGRRLAITYTDESFTGTDIDTAHSDSAMQRVRAGEIHAEIWPYVGAGGVGWTDGQKGFAFVHESAMTYPEGAVQVMVHEIMHALGLLGHPHHNHASVLSYQHQSTVVFDNVPLVDVAVLYDMSGWGNWSGNIQTVIGTADAVQFGVHDVDLALIPWVDAGYMPLPSDDALRGRATWTGPLVGKTTALAQDVYGVAELGVNFDNFDGWADFHTIRYWNGTMWNRQGWSYGLYVNGYYFDSDDEDGIPDVVGAIYGWDAEVAAGTLQRPELTAAFGAERD